MFETTAKFLRALWPQILGMALCLGLMIAATRLLERSTREANSKADRGVSCLHCPATNQFDDFASD